MCLGGIRALTAQDGTRIALRRWWRVLAGTTTPAYQPVQRGMRFTVSLPLLILP